MFYLFVCARVVFCFFLLCVLCVCLFAGLSFSYLFNYIESYLSICAVIDVLSTMSKKVLCVVFLGFKTLVALVGYSCGCGCCFFLFIFFCCCGSDYFVCMFAMCSF